ncbi:lipid A deacylase LpxR family protein [Sulfurimonas autotrophica]|uniref:Lipid A deacylase LpxR family protein n=1 Tax=Sulfurimonas autotrophica (strain ATCC BAA-671 / DSM 16294 / JCM 11897 / OK10) TaxID=563040 RepID=E0UUX3_SULAO|nr:lipid A deacylase LpxR family protein [Sulfurimonas autotrophica]ADN08485.1 Protein of unknown function DUF2219 [Sulfurimonas autotrophica DSM 16294]
MKIKLLALSLLLFISLRADEYSFVVYNDFFAGEDGHFTNGVSLSWLEDNEENSYTNFLTASLGTLSFPLENSKNYNAGLSINQIILTPINTEKATPQYNDLPYAGYLSLATYLFEWDSYSFNEYSIEIGVVGKESGAEYVQNKFHKIIGNDESKGWNTQLGTRYTFNLFFHHGVKPWQGKIGQNLQADWFYHYGATLGTFDVSGFGGTAFRIGQNYVHNFNSHYPYLKEEAGLVSVDGLKQGFGWSVSAGADGEYLAYSYVFNKAKNDGYAVHIEGLSAVANLSASLYYNHHKFRFFYEIPSHYIKEERGVNIFGGFMYSYKF